MNLNKNIFREYDIRGIYPSELNETVAYYVGLAYGTRLKEKGKDTTVLGYDNRVSSMSLANYMANGLLDAGVNVKNIGLVTTPMCYFAANYLYVNASMMITASHNPKEYNGFKFSYNGIHNAYGKDVTELYEMILTGKAKKADKRGTIENINIEDEYIKMILDDIRLGDKKIKVIYDCGNGTTSIIADKIFNKLNIEKKGIYNISDGNFPNHQPDPAVSENLNDLRQEVVNYQADIGIAFDGDGDRVGFVDEKGRIIPIEEYMIIMWRDICDRVSNRKCLFDVKCSKALEDELLKLGVEPICYRTGGTYTRAKIAELNIPLGGELSGHICFRDRFKGYDDGIYNGIRLIELLSNTDKNLSSLSEGINKYYNTPEIKIEVTDNNKFKIIEKIEEYAKSMNYQMLTIDGVKVKFPDCSSALVRASNTTPCITLRFEAKTQERLQEIYNEFITKLNEIIKELA